MNIQSTVHDLCDWVILISAVIGAVIVIYKNIVKVPADKIKEIEDKKFTDNFKKNLSKEIPSILDENNKIVKKEIKDQNEKLATEINKAIDEKVINYIEELERVNLKQNEKIDVLMEGSKNLLREKIMTIYHRGVNTRTITFYDKEALDTYYKDYKAEKGNTFIDKYYARMQNWEVIGSEADIDE